MLTKLKALATSGRSFAFETTLASRTYHQFLRSCQAKGYRVVLFYFYLNSTDLAVERVRERVLAGGHHIPEADIRRRYVHSLVNLKDDYIPLVDTGVLYNNSGSYPKPIALFMEDQLIVHQPEHYKNLTGNPSNG